MNTFIEKHSQPTIENLHILKKESEITNRLIIEVLNGVFTRNLKQLITHYWEVNDTIKQIEDNLYAKK